MAIAGARVANALPERARRDFNDARLTEVDLLLVAERKVPTGTAISPYDHKMVLPVRIELTTSALPRMRSTTELRQHSARAAGPAPRGSGPFARGRRLVKAKAAGLSANRMNSQGNDAEKKARLAAALRENLRKRKAQAREVNQTPPAKRDTQDLA